MKKILECSSKGDKRFSALFVKVSVNGVVDTIENHYQKSKLFLEKGVLVSKDKKSAKGLKPYAFKINKYILPIEFGEQYYKLLWYKYLKTNKHLEEVLSKYEDYSDMFKGKAHNCQADVIRAYMQSNNGVKYKSDKRGTNLFNECLPLNNLLKKINNHVIVNGDIFEGIADIIGHQVNNKGVMGLGIANTIKNEYTEAYTEYVNLFKTSENKMGMCQIVKSKNKYIANIFGQESYGRNKNVIYTDYAKLEEGLNKLKTFAKDNNLIASIPFNIGCGLGNGSWDEVLKIIERVFKDYYVLIYKYN